MATNNTIESREITNLSLDNIIVEEQIRSGINTKSESFKALMLSIKDRGVLEPVLVTPKDSKYLLLCGERRYLAAKKLNHEVISVRVVNAVTQKDEILAIQLTENLQREDLNPIDQAKGIVAFIHARHPGLYASEEAYNKKEYNLDEVLSGLVVYERRPEDLPQEIRVTVTQIFKIVGKSTKTLFNVISLLKLVPRIQDAIAAGILPVSQGYIFAANIDNPDLLTIFDAVIENPVTNAKLETMFKTDKKAKPVKEPAPIPMKKQVTQLQSIKSYIETGAGIYTKPDLEALIEELRAFLALAEKQLETAPVPAP